MLTFKQQCIILRKQDHTLPEIVKITGRPKASVFFHIQNIALSLRKRQEISEASRALALSLSASRRGKSARGFRKFSRWDPNTVLLVAHLMFDGEIKRDGCVYNNRSLALINTVEQAMKAVYDFEPRRYQDQKTGVHRISYFNVALGAYVKEKSTRLLRDVVQFSKPLKREFLRAFFDDEGCMDLKPAKNNRRVRGYQKNVSILKIIQLLLVDFGINSHIHQPNEVVITGKDNLRKFQNEINFSSGVRINGNRSNSVWKQHLEKREILKRALASFQTV